MKTSDMVNQNNQEFNELKGQDLDQISGGKVRTGGYAVIDIYTCVGCGGCVKVCPSNAIVHKDGAYEVVISVCSSSAAYTCGGICVVHCPVEAVKLCGF